ncbi:MAG: tRNA (adenosine(37)-N6)-threonylcarbamoyltransferase complex ATPase subunit type 1 TsaE, partial [Candidatus Pacebacteria bacterium]|nr:tRNA (adenosine(37)-N6)-threonylcarbamoyltransferase complex ATPase subunit type 1 TsaE [Candidatus Paceibacterota bacterium]
TFVILKRFKVQDGRFKDFYHIDCYRIKKPKEILDLGFKEIISNPKNIVAIEWADRIRKILPKNSIILKFEFIDQNKRKIKTE